MQRWAYKVVKLDRRYALAGAPTLYWERFASALNQFDADGWRVISVTNLTNRHGHGMQVVALMERSLPAAPPIESD